MSKSILATELSLLYMVFTPKIKTIIPGRIQESNVCKQNRWIQQIFNIWFVNFAQAPLGQTKKLRSQTTTELLWWTIQDSNL